MRKIDGLRLDYHTGEADIALPPAFEGQSLEFQTMAIGYWISRLESKREHVAQHLTPKRTSPQSSKTIEQLIAAGNAVLYFAPLKEARKPLNFMATFVCNEQKRLTFWESDGYATYRVIGHSAGAPGNSWKGYRRLAKQHFDQWVQQQTFRLNAGPERLI